MSTEMTSELVSRLEGYGCRLLPAPATIGGIPFQFSAILVGPPSTLDLVIVERISMLGQQRFLQQAQGVALALDAVQSRRSLTLVLYGANLDRDVEAALNRFARILNVQEALDGGSYEDLQLWDALAILRPMVAPTTVSGLRSDPVQRVLEALHSQRQVDLEQAGLLKASVFGPEAVTEAFSDWVRAALASESSS